VLSHLVESWSALYANHAALRTSIEFLHIGGLTAGGGCAIAADLAMLTADRDVATTRTMQLQLLQRTHGIVLFGLAALSVSGVLLFAADVETFLYSKTFWLKMALLAALLINGAVMQRGERRVTCDDAGAWARLRRTAAMSLCLWFLTTLAGAALPNIG
jgi:uncharacterized membrane protein